MPSKILWTRQAREDLREIRAFIARDAPATASTFVRQLRKSVDRLRDFPLFGQVVPELLRGAYRIIYRVQSSRIDILTVYHSARLLDDADL